MFLDETDMHVLLSTYFLLGEMIGVFWKGPQFFPAHRDRS